MSENVDHPAHYGGADNPYEAIKVIDAWGLNFGLGNVVKYVSRAGEKSADTELNDLKKARWYLDHEIGKLEEAGQFTASGDGSHPNPAVRNDTRQVFDDGMVREEYDLAGYGWTAPENVASAKAESWTDEGPEARMRRQAGIPHD